MDKIQLKALAKINLGLDVLRRREDGYHEVKMIMQTIGLYDELELRKVKQPGIQVKTNLYYLPTNESNLVYKAAKLLFDRCDISEGVEITLTKRIPIAAGMAGGSTDAAAVLVGLNELFGCPLTPAALCEVGLRLGADVPFCIMGGAQITEGIGETLTPITPLGECELVIACGGEGVSTPAAYKALDTLYGNFDPAAYTPRREEMAALKAALHTGNLSGVCASAFNLFESVIPPERPVARGIKETLLSAGALTALMSGSGPSVFGIFPKGDGSAARARVRA